MDTGEGMDTLDRAATSNESIQDNPKYLNLCLVHWM